MSNLYCPAPDAIIAALGPAQAVLYGRIWRYCQGGGTCYASIATLAAECGVSRPTVCRWIADLIELGYIDRESGQTGGKTSVLRTTRKWIMGGVSNLDRGVSQNLTTKIRTKIGLEDKDVSHPLAGADNTGEQAPTAADPERLAKPVSVTRKTKSVEPGALDAIRAMVDTMADARGYPVANYGRHVKPAKRLIDLGHGPDDVRRTVAYIRRSCRHLDGQPITMVTVSKYIGLAPAAAHRQTRPITEIDWIEVIE